MAIIDGRWLWVLAFMATGLVSGLPAQEGVTVRIEVDRGSYRAGDAINVRLTLRNTSDRPVAVPSFDDPNLVSFNLRDAAGHEVKALSGEAGSLALSATSLKPGQELTLTSAEGKEWWNLRDWGFELRVPGSYTVEGTPVVSGSRPKSGPRRAPEDAVVRSNRASFQIEG
jgi:hypothetical protein